MEPELRQELEIHLRACPDCWVIYDSTRKTLLIFRRNEPYPMPEDVKERLAAAIRRRLAEATSQP